MALLSYTAVQGGVYGYVGAAMNELVTSHGGASVPWYLYALAMMAVVATLGYRHIELSGKVLGVLLVCEVGIVMVINIAVIGKGGDSGLSTAVLHPGNFFSGAPGIALIFALAGYIGFEATAVFRDEARDPARTIPRATYVALLLIGGFYALSSWVMVSAWGDDGSVTAATDNPANMLTNTATRYVGSVAGDLVADLLDHKPFRRAAVVPQCAGALHLLARQHPGAARAVWPFAHSARLAAHRVGRADRLRPSAGGRLGNMPSGSRHTGVHLVRRSGVGRHRRADDRDLGRGDRVLPPHQVRHPAVEHGDRTDARLVIKKIWTRSPATDPT